MVDVLAVSSEVKVKFADGKILRVYNENVCPSLPKLCSLPANGKPDILRIVYSVHRHVLEIVPKLKKKKINECHIHRNLLQEVAILA